MHHPALSRFACIAALLAMPAGLEAQSSPGLLVDVAWLAANRSDPRLVLIHVGPDEAYAAAHLAGARLANHEVLSVGHGVGTLSLEMPDAAQLQRDLGILGVSDDSRVVVVFDRGWVTPATRVLLALRYAGFGDRTSLLDGGQPAWVQAGHPVTTDVPPPGRGRPTVRLNPAILADVAAVQAVRPGGTVRIVDARGPVYYSGPGSSDRPAGHVPGAVNIPYTTMVTEGNLLLSLPELRERFRAAGIAEGESLIVYCHIGQQATLVFTAATLLGIPVRLYDGSFEDWGARRLPTEGGRGGS